MTRFIPIQSTRPPMVERRSIINLLINAAMMLGVMILCVFTLSGCKNSGTQYPRIPKRDTIVKPPINKRSRHERLDDAIQTFQNFSLEPPADPEDANLGESTHREVDYQAWARDIAQDTRVDPDPKDAQAPRAYSSSDERYQLDNSDVNLSLTERRLKTIFTSERPVNILPRRGYFENTYVGGDLSFAALSQTLPESMRSSLKAHASLAHVPQFDPPIERGVALSAQLSHASLESPSRVILQVGLRGSDQYGWRRAPLNLMVVVDPHLIERIKDDRGQTDRHDILIQLLKPILDQLTPLDQVGVRVGHITWPLMSSDHLKDQLITPISTQLISRQTTVTSAFKDVEATFARNTQNPHKTAATDSVMLLCGQGCATEREALRARVHQFNLRGGITHVMCDEELRQSYPRMWTVAEAGHGSYFEFDMKLKGYPQAVVRQFGQMSRVVARLLRLNVRLASNVELIEIIGSRMLTHTQAQEVKASEAYMDRHLSQTMGIEHDRGQDDDGLQVVIPAFYGGDRHVISMILWVDAPGAVAEVSLNYKDLIKMNNATDAAAVSIAAAPAPLTMIHHEVREVALHQWAATSLRHQLKGVTKAFELSRLWDELHDPRMYMYDAKATDPCVRSQCTSRDRLAFMHLLISSKLGRASAL